MIKWILGTYQVYDPHDWWLYHIVSMFLDGFITQYYILPAFLMAVVSPCSMFISPCWMVISLCLTVICDLPQPFGVSAPSKEPFSGSVGRGAGAALGCCSSHEGLVRLENHKWGYPQMDGLQWKILLKWMIWGYPYFRRPPYSYLMLFIDDRWFYPWKIAHLDHHLDHDLPMKISWIFHDFPAHSMARLMTPEGVNLSDLAFWSEGTRSD